MTDSAAVGGPLDGIFVLEVANWIAAPSGGALLADLGARVVKVEPPTGDSMRYSQRQPFNAQGKSQQNGECIDHGFTLDNRGKQSVALNLMDPRGQALVQELAKKADILITNLLPVRLQKYGLGYDQLRAVNPRLIYASVTGWGLLGSDADKMAFDMTAFFARGGITNLLTPPGSPQPVKPRSGAGDHQTGLATFGAILAALLQRHKTGQGSFVETSLLRTATWNLGEDLAPCLVDRKEFPASPITHDNPLVRLYKASDERWFLCCMPITPDVYWPKFCTALGRPEWATDERYNTQGKRLKERVQLGADIQQIFETDTMEAWIKRLDAAGCIAGPLALLSEVVDDPQLRLNGAFQQVTHPVAGTFDTISAPFNISGAELRVRGPGPEPGAHTSVVLKQELGLPEERLQELTAAGVIGFRPVKGSPIDNWVKKTQAKL